ncbi:MAG: peroxidase-related enzyme [Desulfobulbaceae bacterium]|nr:peroxidase-related enzyme [Desulfobulbaceae bacterium]
MARIATCDTTTASTEVKEIFAEIEGAFGKVPNLFLTYAKHLPLLKANWNKVKAVMGEGALSQKTKQAIAVLVSRDNGCAYCVAAHTGALRAMGISEDEIKTIEEDLSQANFSVMEQALISFARKANTAPTRISDEEFELVKNAGASDAEIIEALGVMELFTAFNKFLDSLQVDIDF